MTDTAAELAPLARRIWRRLEPLHAITYFAPESHAALEAIGMKGFWMGYFAGRSAALGAVGPKVVAATFYNFHPALVARAVPDCWGFAPPAAVRLARRVGLENALPRVFGADVGAQPGLGVLAPLAEALALAACDEVGGCTLFAGHAEQPWPDGPAPIRAWWAATLVREHRGDGHIAALVDAGVGPCEALVLQNAYGNIPRPILQVTRAWSDEEWDGATERLAARGWVGPGGVATDAGRDGLAAIEQRTDELATGPVRAIGVDAASALADAALPVARAVMDAGGVPSVTPMFADDNF